MHAGDLIADRFELMGLVGGGAMGVVFRAHDHTGKVDVAVKVLRAGDGDGDAARFAREAEVLADLQHPHVVRYIAHGATPPGEPYLVMEWIEGEDVGRRLTRGRMPVEASVVLAARVASALAEAHARGVVHRDVKPNNLFLPGGDVSRVKVLDFGIARVSGVARATQTGAVLGTPGYLPPEQARGEDVIDPRADVFSLGCVLFECLTGAPAFAGRHLPAVLAKILFEPAPRARALSPEVPEALDHLILRMLSKDAADRPTSAEAAAALADLERIAGGAASEVVTAARAPSLTSDEQRVLSVVMIGGAPGAGSLDVEALREAAQARGARLEGMADGSVAAILLEALPPLEAAAAAARLAHALREAAPQRPIVVATGRSGGLFKRTVGDAINRAVALLDAAVRSGAPPGPPLVDQVSARLLEKRFELSPAPVGFAIGGELEPASIGRPLGGRSVHVGRRAEVSMLTTLLAESVEESVARAALVTAPSGFGKSRLAHEMVAVARREAPGAAVWTARGDALRAGAVFGLLADALRSAVDLRPGEPPAASQDRLRAHVEARLPPADRTRVTEFLGEISGIPFPDEESPALFTARTDARLMREQMVRAFADLLRAECAARPVVLVLDDLQWGDALSIRCVGRALSTLKGAPLFVLGLGRPEVSQLFPKLWEDEGVVNLRLKELSRKAGAELVEHALGPGAAPALVDRLLTQAGGHALYLEELIRAAAEGRDDTGPETVLALVDARLSQLAPAARRVLRAASVFGSVCWSGGVAALCADGGDGAARHHLEALAALDVLVRSPESRFAGQDEYAFAHVLLREGAYALLTDADRALGHGLAAAWLEAQGEPDPLVLAEHFARAGEHPRAARAYARAAELAYRAGDSDAAIRHARRGLALDLPDDLRGALLGVLCEAYVWCFEWDTGASLVGEALRLTREGSVPWVHAATAQLWLSAARGKVDTLPGQIERLERAAVEPEAVSLVARALGVGVFALDMLGRFDASTATLARLGAIVEPIADRDWVARGWLEFARAHVATMVASDPWRGLSLARAASASFQDADYPRGLPVAWVVVGICLWLLGAHEEAERTLRGAAVEWDLGAFALLRDYYLGRVLLDRGALDAARAAAHALVTRGEATRKPGFEARGHGLLARVALRSGDLGAAEREVEAAMASTPGASLYRLVVELEQISLRLAQGRAGEALRLAQGALIANEARRFNRIHARVVLVEALVASGAPDEARAALADARAILLADADKIGAPVLRKSFLERVPEHARLFHLATVLLPPGSRSP